MTSGRGKVDLRAGFKALELKCGFKSVRLDSGGTKKKSSFRAPDLSTPNGVIPLRLIHAGRMEGDHVWLRYEVVKEGC